MDDFVSEKNPQFYQKIGCPNDQDYEEKEGCAEDATKK